MIEPIVLVHGGAGDIPEWRVVPKINWVQRAAKVGYHILTTGGSVLDAVEAAVKVMEDDEAFNAGDYFISFFNVILITWYENFNTLVWKKEEDQCLLIKVQLKWTQLLWKGMH